MTMTNRRLLQDFVEDEMIEIEEITQQFGNLDTTTMRMMKR